MESGKEPASEQTSASQKSFDGLVFQACAPVEGADSAEKAIQPQLAAERPGEEEQPRTDPNLQPIVGVPKHAKKARRWIDRLAPTFAIFGGAAAVISAVAAVYTAGQLRGSSAQVDKAIGKIADAATAAQSKPTRLTGSLL
jgi:hypothetical protein